MELMTVQRERNGNFEMVYGSKLQMQRFKYESQLSGSKCRFGLSGKPHEIVVIQS
jgi:hypothetical protein